MESEFSDGNWICPDIKNFTINNEPELYKKGDGTSLNFVVNSCENATRIDKKNGLSSYTNTWCKKNIDSENTAYEMVVWSKQMTQAISTPQDYFENIKPATYFTNRSKTGLSTSTVRMVGVEAI